jgi:hypothetical protein
MIFLKLAYLKKIFVPLSLKTTGTIETTVTPSIMAQSKIVVTKPQYISITNHEIVKNSKSEPKNSHSCVPLRE